MLRHWAYLQYVLKHKWYVFIECLKLGVPIWIAILHDWDKFLPDEWFPYAHFFHNPDGSKRQIRDRVGYYKPYDTGNLNFDTAWFLHQARNKHHWQYWCLPMDGGIGIRAMPIPEIWLKEMLADWRGAGRAQGTSDTLAWYTSHKKDLVLHVDARVWIEKQLGYRK